MAVSHERAFDVARLISVSLRLPDYPYIASLSLSLSLSHSLSLGTRFCWCGLCVTCKQVAGHVVELKLRGNAIGDASAVALANALRYHGDTSVAL